MKKIYLAYLLLIILSACGSKNTNSVYLNGEIKGLGNDTLYIYGTDKFYNRMDTLLVKDDKFSATLTTDTLASTWLQFSDGTEYPLYLDKGDNIKIKGSAAELTSLEIMGNVPNEELTAFQKELKGLSTPSEKALEEKAEAFINSHPSSLVSIYLLEKYFVQKPQPDFSLIKEMTEYMTGGRVVVLGQTGRNFAAGMSGGVAYVWNKDGNFDYFCNMEMVELSLIEEASYRKELHELIRQHYLYTGSKLARILLDNWNHYVDQFIQVVPIEYKKVLQEEQMRKLQQKIADMQRDY